MTTAHERSALEAETVPVLHRVRALLARFPDGPLPAAAVKALRDSLIDRRRSGAENRPAAELAAIIRDAAPFTPGDLRRMSERLREATPAPAAPLTPDDLDLPVADIDTVAEHLVREGTTLDEVRIGLGLTTPTAPHADAIGDVALIGRSVQIDAIAAMHRLPDTAGHLYQAATRAESPRSSLFRTVLGRLPIEDIDGLLDTLAPGPTAALAVDLTEHSRPPSWFRGHRRFAAAFASEARRRANTPDPRPDDLVTVVRWLDVLRYGHCALLGFAPGERETAVARLRSALASDRSLAAVRDALAADPDDTELVWLHREVEAARRTDLPDFAPGFALRVTVAGPNSIGGVSLHALVDGVPVVAARFGRGVADRPERLLDHGAGLRAAVEPHTVRLAEADCVEECCGALMARVRRDEASGLVEWEVWDTEDPDGTRGLLAFSGEAYDAEVARADTDRAWEWPARRAARLLRERLAAEPDLLARWDCRITWVEAWNRERSTVRVTMIHPARQVTIGEPALQFTHEITVPDAVDTDDAEAAAIVDALAARMRATDPKSFFRVTGGSSAHAVALEYAWPEG